MSGEALIRRCDGAERGAIGAIINDAAQAYRGVIPPDRWHEPYMPDDELAREIAAGVVFYGYARDARLIGVMGVQPRGEVTLIRHAYVRTDARRGGIGTALLKFLETLTAGPILIGTWADAHWAVDFYRRNGYRLIVGDEKNALLDRYWTIPDRQRDTSVVLARRL